MIGRDEIVAESLRGMATRNHAGLFACGKCHAGTRTCTSSVFRPQSGKRTENGGGRNGLPIELNPDQSSSF